MLLLLPILFSCAEEGIPYDPKWVPVSKASEEELIKIQEKLSREFKTTDPINRAIFDLANGVISLKLKKSDEAIKYLSQNLKIAPPRERFLLLYKLGEAYFEKGDKLGARRVWEEALNTDISSPIIPILLTKLADLVKDDDPRLSSTLLSSALAIGLKDKEDQEEAEIRLSQALKESGDSDADYWNLSNALWYSGSKTEMRAYSQNDIFMMATGHFLAKRYKDAISNYERLLAQKVPYERYLLQQVYLSAKQLGDLRLQNETLTTLTGEPTEPKKPETSNSIVQLARFQWNNDETAIARTLLEGVLKKEVNLKAKILLSRIDAEARNYSSALYQLDSIVRENPNSNEAEEALFWSAWYLYLDHRFAEAKRQFALYRERYGKNSNFYQASYFWEAMATDALGDKDAENQILLSLAQADPFSYYGLLAQRELGQLPLKRPEPVPQMKFTRDLLTNTPKAYLEWLKFAERLIAVGLDELGLFYLEAAIKMGVDADALPWRLRLYSAQLYIQANKQLAGIQQIYKLKTEQPTLPDWYIWLLYPRPYWNEITKAAKEFEIDPYMIISIMRQESAFNPKALSPADAYGLMQLLPATASNIAKQFHLPVPKTGELFDPSINIPLGTANIKDLLKRFRGRWVLVLASYNASPKMASKWLDTRWRPESLEFIEEIPYTETRTYVKLIIRNYLTYRALYQPDGPYPEGLFSH